MYTICKYFQLNASFGSISIWAEVLPTFFFFFFFCIESPQDVAMLVHSWIRSRRGFLLLLFLSYFCHTYRPSLLVAGEGVESRQPPWGKAAGSDDWDWDEGGGTGGVRTLEAQSASQRTAHSVRQPGTQHRRRSRKGRALGWCRTCSAWPRSKLQALVYDILPWRKVPESDARSVASLLPPLSDAKSATQEVCWLSEWSFLKVNPLPFVGLYNYVCNGAEWSKDKTQAAESIKWRPQQAYGSNQFLLVQPQTVFSTHTKLSRSRIDKRTARATGNTHYRYSKIAPLDHKMADNCVSLARTNTLSSTITKLIKTSKTSNKSYSYHLLNCINKMYTHDLFYLQQEWEAWLAPVYIQIRTTKSQLTQCTKYKRH